MKKWLIEFIDNKDHSNNSLGIIIIYATTFNNAIKKLSLMRIHKKGAILASELKNIKIKKGYMNRILNHDEAKNFQEI